MTRREEIEKAAFNYINSDAVSAENMQLAFGDFINGAEWMQKKMIEKACECIIKLHNWPTQYEEYAKFQEEFIKEFRKAMEE